MCVLICRVGQAPLLAANRDEVYARPFSSPRRWVADTPFWAPRDEEEGGTWIGVNRNGLVVAITNRSRLPAEGGRASRGLLVTGALSPTLAHLWTDRLEELLPIVERINIPDASHLMHEENASAVNEAIVGFLGRHRDRPMSPPSP